jgi:hypothetical protein
LRIAKRENGIRIYEPAHSFDAALTPDDRLHKLILAVAGVLAPSPERSLRPSSPDIVVGVIRGRLSTK